MPQFVHVLLHIFNVEQQQKYASFTFVIFDSREVYCRSQVDRFVSEI